MTKKIILFTMVAVMSVATAFAAPLMGAPVATVNLIRNTAITQAEVDQMVADYKAMGANIGPAQALDILINNEVYRQGAERDGVKVSMNEVDAQIRQVRAGLEQQLGQAMTDEQFGEFVKAQTGMTMDEYRQALSDQILTEKYLQAKKGQEIQKNVSEMQIPSKDVENFYRKNRQQFYAPENVKLAHVFIPKTDDEAENARNAALLTDVAEQIKTGKISFEKAVIEYSQDPGSNQIGGDIGWLTMDDQASRQGLGEEFFNSAMNLDAGEVSGMVESNSGYHILKVSVHNWGKLLGIDEKINPVENVTVRQYIEGLLRQAKSQEIINKALSDLIEELRGQARIRIY